METTDTEVLVTAARQGDAAAFDELILRFTVAVRAVVARRLGRAAEVDEVVQEVFLRGYRCLHQLQEESRFGGWICRIAARLAINRAVRGRPLHTAEDVSEYLADSSVESPLVAVLRAEQQAELAGMIARLSVLDQQTLQAYYFDGYSVREISLRSGAPEGTVKRRLHSARMRLRDELMQAGTVSC